MSKPQHTSYLGTVVVASIALTFVIVLLPSFAHSMYILYKHLIDGFL